GLSLLTACCLFSFGAVAVLPDATPTPVLEVGLSDEERAELQASATADVTDTPAPTDTVVPTNTLAPTTMPEPTDTLTPQATSTIRIVGVTDSRSTNTPRPS